MYYEELLPKSMKAELAKEDAVIGVVESYFSNLEIYEEEFAEVDINVGKIDDKVIIDKGQDIKNANKETKMFGVIYDTMMDYLKSERNEFIVGMIDQIEEGTPLYEEYKENFLKIFGQEEYDKEFGENSWGTSHTEGV